MLGGVSIYSVYTRKLSQRGEYNKFKIPTFGNLGHEKTLAWIAQRFLFVSMLPKFTTKRNMSPNR